MENTLKNKAKLFALYWGQKVMKARITNPLSHHKFTALMNVDINAYTLKENWFLELTPLSHITDEEHEEILNNPIYNTEISVQKNKIGNYYTSDIAITDYLRSQGYALPWMGLSVEQLVSFGWVKLREA